MTPLLGKGEHQGVSTVACVVVTIGAVAVGFVYLRTPSVIDPFYRLAAALVTLAVIGVTGYFAAFHAWRPGARLVAVAAPVSVLMSAILVLRTDDLHWRWSRDDFARVAAGETIDCSADEPCMLGWWPITGTARYGDIAIVWLPDEGGCYAGSALAKPTRQDRGPDSLRGRLVSALDTGSLAVYPFRDGWYEVCIST